MTIGTIWSLAARGSIIKNKIASQQKDPCPPMVFSVPKRNKKLVV